MIEPWFDPNHWAWLPGTALGCLGGLWGGLAGVLVPLRRGRVLVFGLGLLLVVLAAASVVVGLTALVSGQPFGVWFFLVVPILPCAVLLLVFLCLLPKLYRRAEEDRAGNRGIS